MNKGTTTALKRYDSFKRKISKNGTKIKNAFDNNIVKGYVLKADTKIVADCNYNNGENLRFLEAEKLDRYIPTIPQAHEFNDKKKKVEDKYEYDWDNDEIIINDIRLKYHSTWIHRGENKQRAYKSEDGKIVKKVPEFFRERLGMKTKIETNEGKHSYSLRKTIVEPVIGNVKYNLGFTEFLIGGLDGAKLELNLVSLAHNLKKIWAARGKLIINNKNIDFCLIVENNQMNCDSACLVWRGCHLSCEPNIIAKIAIKTIAKTTHA